MDETKFIGPSPTCYPQRLEGLLPLSAALLALTTTLLAQSKQDTLQKVYAASDHLAHLVDATGKDIAIPKEQDQVDVSSPKLAPNQQTAGWLLHQDNCCTSYSVPTRLVLHPAGKRCILSGGLRIYDWCLFKAAHRPPCPPAPSTAWNLDTYSSTTLIRDGNCRNGIAIPARPFRLGPKI